MLKRFFVDGCIDRMKSCTITGSEARHILKVLRMGPGDRLVIMDQGRIVEEGSHAELIAKGGLYASLWKRQSGGFLAEDGAA